MAAPIITCPACTKKFKGKEGLEGKKIKCPLCTTPFVVPANLSGQVKAGAPQTGAQAKKSATQAKAEIPSAKEHGARVQWNKEDDEVGGQYGLGEHDVRTRCPNCANLMESEDAVICLFCGYNTLTREWGSTVKATAVTGGQHFIHLLPGIIFLTMLLAFAYGVLFFCLELPPLVENTWASFFDHESMRMWIVGILLAFMWAFGTLAFRRLILNPRPKEVEKQETGTI